MEKLRKEREKYVQQKMRELAEKGEQTLGEAMLKALRQQAAKKGFKFENDKEEK